MTGLRVPTTVPLLVVVTLLVIPASALAFSSTTPGAPSVAPAVPAPRPLPGDSALAPPPAAPPASALSVRFTLALENDSTFSGNVWSTGLTDATYSAYDPVYNRWYFATGPLVEVIDPSTFRVETTLPIPGRADGIAVDPLHERVYVANATRLISVFNSSTLAPVGSITLPTGWFGTSTIGVDPLDDRLIASSDYNATALLVDAGTGAIVGSLPLGPGIPQILYDPYLGELLIANASGASIAEVNAATGSVAGALSTGGGSVFGLAIDPSGVDVYASGPGLGIALLSAVNGTRIAHDRTGSFPGGVAFDAKRSEVLMADEESDLLTAFGAPNLTPLWSTSISPGPVPIYAPIYPIDAPALDSVLLPAGFLDTLDAISLANHTVYVSQPDRSFPESIVEDAACACYVVGNSVAPVVYFVAPSTFQVVRVVTVPNEVQALLYVPSTGDLLAAEWGGLAPGPGGIEVLNGTTGAELKFLPGLSDPNAFAYDPANGVVYATESGTTTITEIDATTVTIVANLTVGKYPTTLAYVPSLEELFVGTQANVTVFNTSSGTVTGWIDTEPSPVSMAYDATRGRLYVGNLTGFRNQVTAIDVRNRTIGPSLTLQFPLGLAVDPADGTVFIGNITSDLTEWNVTAGTTSALPVGVESETLLWTSNDQLIATDTLDSSLYDLAATSTVHLYNATFSATPSVAPTDTPVRFALNASGAVGAVTYSYSGLPAGCVAVGGSFSCNATTSGTYLVLGTITDTAGNAVTQRLTLWVGDPRPVWLNESGLAAGSAWGANVTARGGTPSASSPSIATALPDGVYRYAGWTAQAGEGNPTGIFLVAGGPTSVTVAFAGAGYEVEFLETGLPSGTPWGVRLSNGDSGSGQSGEIDLREANGSYSFTAPTENPSYRSSGGSFAVAGGTVRVSVAYALVVYPVTFTASGIQPGTLWSVTITGSTLSGYGPQFTTNESNGTYAWSATAYGLPPVTGTVTVDGAEEQVTVTFGLPGYLVTVDANGLPGGRWWFNLTAVAVYSSLTAEIELNLTNGSYPFTVGAPTGYTATPSSGTLQVDGGPVAMTVAFTSGTGGPVPLVVSRFSADPGSIPLGGTTNLSVVAAGGTPPYSYQYRGLPAGCASSDQSWLLCTPNVTGNFTVVLTVLDRFANSTFAQLVISVLPPLACGCGPHPVPSVGGLPWELLAVGAGLAVLVAVGVVVLVARRRRRATSPEAGSGAEGGAPNPAGDPDPAGETEPPDL